MGLKVLILVLLVVCVGGCGSFASQLSNDNGMPIETVSDDIEVETVEVFDDEKSVPDFDRSDILAMNRGNLEFSWQFNQHGNLRHINGKFSNITINSPEDALMALYSIRSLTGISDPKNSFSFRQESVNVQGGGRSYSFNQVHNGVRVERRTLFIRTDMDGVANFLDLSYEYRIAINTTPSISQRRAEAIARAELGDDWGFVDVELIIRLPRQNYDNFRLIWMLNDGEGSTVVDAQSGEFLGWHSRLIQ